MMVVIARRALAVLLLTMLGSSMAVAARAATTTVALTSDGAAPRVLTIAVGDVVTFRNDDDERHRLRARDPEDVDTSDIDPGASVGVTLVTEGVYTFVDERTEDPAFTVTITVTTTSGGGSGGASPPPPDSGAGTGASAPSTVDVAIPDRLFAPSAVTVAAGGTVRWVNTDGAHTVTARDRSFDSGIFDAGATWARTFPTAGTFAYLCLLHPDMTGTVTVVAADGSTGSGPASAPTTSGTGGTTAGGSVAATGDTGSSGGTASGASSGDPTSAPGTTATSTASSGTASVSIVDLAFAPAGLRVPAGTTVAWTNDGAALHTVTSTVGGSLDSGLLEPGASYRATLGEGVYDYLCVLHPEMTGRIVAEAAATDVAADVAPPAPAPPATTSEVPTATSGEGSAEGVSVLDATGSRTTTTVAILDFRYSPTTVRVPAGTTVTWRNDGRAPHTVTSTDGGPLDSPILSTGESYRRRLDRPGTYAYLCTLHPEMVGRVEVTAASGAGPPAPSEDGSTDDGFAAEFLTGDAQGGSSASVEAVVVEAAARAFTPANLEVPVGTTVRWVMADDEPHTVTATGAFDSGVLAPGETFELTTDTVGTFAYLCLVHPEMTGTLQVVAAADGAGPIALGDADPQDPVLGGEQPVRSTSSGLPFAATVLTIGMLAAFVSGRVTAGRR